MKTKAYAKVNFALDVIGIRDNGYHDLRMIMVPIDFYDEITLIRNKNMSFECSNKNIVFDEHNTIVKAIKLMKDRFNITDNFKVILKKRIPMQAGLAGGSADGAAVIRLINKMYRLNLSKEQIKELCVSIGADVLFCYYQRPALVEGIGDVITPIKIKDSYHILLVKPRGGVSTKECYDSLDLDTCLHPNVDRIVEGLANGKDVIDLLGNSLEEPAIKLCNDIKKVKTSFKDAGAQFSIVTGSGSTVYTLNKNEGMIAKIESQLNENACFVKKTKILIKNWLLYKQYNKKRC